MKNIADFREVPTNIILAQELPNGILGGDLYHDLAPDGSFLEFIENIYLMCMGCPNIEAQPGFTPEEVEKRLREYSPAADIARAAEGKDAAPYRAIYPYCAKWADDALLCVYGYKGLVAHAFADGQ